MKLIVEARIRDARKAILSEAAVICDQHWTTVQRLREEQGGTHFRYGSRVKEGSSGAGIKWGRIDWSTKDGKATSYFRDLPVGQSGVYSAWHFRLAKEWELREILKTEEQLVPLRKGLKQLGRFLAMVPGLERTLLPVEKLRGTLFEAE